MGTIFIFVGVMILWLVVISLIVHTLGIVNDVKDDMVKLSVRISDIKKEIEDSRTLRNDV